MFELVKNALKDLNIPIFYLTRSENSKIPCIVVNYSSVPELYADNNLIGSTYSILLNVITKSNIEKTNQAVLKAMRESKFKGGRVQATQPEFNGTQVIAFNTAITFNKYISEE